MNRPAWKPVKKLLFFFHFRFFFVCVCFVFNILKYTDPPTRNEHTRKRLRLSLKVLTLWLLTQLFFFFFNRLCAFNPSVAADSTFKKKRWKGYFSTFWTTDNMIGKGHSIATQWPPRPECASVYIYIYLYVTTKEIASSLVRITTCAGNQAGEFKQRPFRSVVFIPTWTHVTLRFYRRIKCKTEGGTVARSSYRFPRGGSVLYCIMIEDRVPRNI